MTGRIADIRLENSEGERSEEFEHGSPIHVVAEIEANQELDRPGFGFLIRSSRGIPVFSTRSMELAAASSPAIGSPSARPSPTRSSRAAT